MFERDWYISQGLPSALRSRRSIYNPYGEVTAISLDKQIHIYSFDTSAFYTDEERKLEIKVNEHCIRKSKLKAEHEIIQSYVDEKLTITQAQSKYRTLYQLKQDEAFEIGDDDRIAQIHREIKGINNSVKQLKAELVSLLQSHRETRTLRDEYVVDKNVISVFESMLTRTLGMETGRLYTDFMVIRTYYFDVIEDMILNGFLYCGEKYICFTASAGQIRTKKTVFIKESVWESYQKTLMCGLTVDNINAHGGININKYFAYLALCNSATDVWDNFDIHKSIIVDDMETMVGGLVDFVDHRSYQVERKYMDVPVTHTDGCGMVLPSCCPKNTMVRLPWIKGLLSVFPFDKFIQEAKSRDDAITGVVTDIYGVDHDILAEGIEVIFTKSQFKMYKYYRDWSDYITQYEQYGCSAGKCNEEEDFLPDAKLNYQMLQTLTDISEDEVRALASKSVDKITKIASDRETMLRVFGASSQYREKNAFQECLQLYPELLSDPYTREVLKQIKKSLIKNARSAKLDLSAKYMFLVPDLYAFCQWLFLGDKNPSGLLQDGEVSCYLYRGNEKLDCLRSPHLYREHAVRKNVVNYQTRKWFSQNAIYTSCHDLISKILQFDCDGDKSLVCADPLLIDIAERNMVDIVPLYYEMKKAEAKPITKPEMFVGLRAAWTGGNIGVISNDITKVWNSDDCDLDTIKILCMENNFCIDYAKTLYKPTRPDEVNTRLSRITNMKAPHFFVYAKNKGAGQVQRIGHHSIDMLGEIVPNKRMNFSAKNIGAFKYQYMLKNPKTTPIIYDDVIELYNEIDKKYRHSIHFYDNESNVTYVRDMILGRFYTLPYDIEDIYGSLVRYLFHSKKSKRKNVFWMCFGDLALRNLSENIPEGSIQCKKCGERFMPTSAHHTTCASCSSYQPVGKKKIVCVDCGVEFEVDGVVKNKKRCDECQLEKNRDYEREKKRKQRKCA